MSALIPWLVVALAIFVMVTLRDQHNKKHTCPYCGGRNKGHDEYCPYAGTGL